jgi:Flp pilus assembly protein protease CpaA
MRIRNRAVLLTVAVFAATVPFIGLPEAGWRLLAAGIVFGLGVVLFALRMLGGGFVAQAL